MTADERLGRALRATAGELPSRIEDWDQLRLRAQRRRRRHQLFSAAVLIIAMVSFVAGLVWFRGGSAENDSVIASPSAAEDAVVVAFQDRIALLTANGGRVLRTLVEGPEAAGTKAVAPTPDGAWVYIGRGTPNCGDEAPTIWRVPTRGGAVEAVAAGWAPRLSPNGRLLAFAEVASESSGGCRPANVLVVRDLTNGSERRLEYSSSVQFVTPFTWSPDSTRLFVVEPPITYHQIEINPTALRKLDPPRRLPGNGLVFVGGELVTSLPGESSTRIVVVDPATGDTGRTVVEIGAPLFLIAADSSGSRFLLTGPLADAPDGHDLYRASSDQPTPTKLASNVHDAAWFSTREPEPPPSSTTEPTTTTTPSPSTPSGPPPRDEHAAREEIIRAFTTWGAVGTLQDVEANLDLIDDTHGIRKAAEQSVRNYPYEVAHDVYRVSQVEFRNATVAIVTYNILIDGVPRFIGRTGRAVLVDGKWKITRETICSDLSLSGATCPPVARTSTPRS